MVQPLQWIEGKQEGLSNKNNTKFFLVFFFKQKLCLLASYHGYYHEYKFPDLSTHTVLESKYLLRTFFRAVFTSLFLSV